MTKRVALVLATSTGGVGVHVLSLARSLVEAGWLVTVCAPASTQFVFDFAEAGARVADVPLRGPGAEPLAVPALRRATAGADLVHAHGLRAGTAAALARSHPLVVTWHNAVLAAGLRGRVLALGERLVARRATVSLGASADLVERVRALGGRDVRLAPVAAPVPVPLRTIVQVRAELALAVGQPLIVCVGRLHPQKAHDVLIRAAARWALLPEPPLVVIVGAGPQHDELAALIRTQDAPVRLLGHRRDAADLLAAADVVVLASRWEARPLAVQEAMSLGRPVVTTDVGGVAALVGDGAMLVRPGDVGALDAAVRVLLAAPAERAALGVRAAARAAQWPDETQANAAVADLYLELLARRGT